MTKAGLELAEVWYRAAAPIRREVIDAYPPTFVEWMAADPDSVAARALIAGFEAIADHLARE